MEILEKVAIKKTNLIIKLKILKNNKKKKKKKTQKEAFNVYMYQ